MLLIQLQGPFQAIVGIAAIPPEKEGQRAFRPDRPDMAALSVPGLKVLVFLFQLHSTCWSSSLGYGCRSIFLVVRKGRALWPGPYVWLILVQLFYFQLDRLNAAFSVKSLFYVGLASLDRY